MRISVIGTGYVGLVSGVCFAEIGHDCVCVDLDRNKVDRINRGEAPIHENGLAEMLARVVGKKLTATTDLRTAVLESDITFVAVGTPFDGKVIDLKYVRQVAAEIGAALREKNNFHAVIVKSTVVPGTTEKVVLPILEETSGKRAGVDFGVGMNPEFLTEGVAINDFMKPDRIVIGGNDDRTIELQRQAYAPFTHVPVLTTNNTTAEMIKYTSNSVLATMISFSNEIGNLCSALGDVDVADVMRGVHSSRYFTSLAADGRPIKAPITSFLWAGCGYGGSCLPKDTKALSAHGVAHGSPMPLLDAVIATNEGQPGRMLALLQKHIPDLKGKQVALLGLAFKEGTDDMRESPSITLAKLLLDAGANVVGFDPIARSTASAALPVGVALVDSLELAIQGADALMLVTRWEEFQAVPALLKKLGVSPVVVDGRRVFEPSSLPVYEGIGR